MAALPLLLSPSEGLHRRSATAAAAAAATSPDKAGHDGSSRTCHLRSNHRAYVNRLKGWRRVATRYEKREVNYLAMVTIAAIVLLWLE
jgi:transposase